MFGEILSEMEYIHARPETASRKNHATAETDYMRRVAPPIMPSESIGDLLNMLCVGCGMRVSWITISDAELFWVKEPVESYEKDCPGFCTAKVDMIISGGFTSLIALLDGIADHEYLRVTRLSFPSKKSGNPLESISLSVEVLMSFV